MSKEDQINEKLAKVRTSEKVARKKLEAAWQDFYDAEKEEDQLTSQKADASNNVTKKNNEVDDLKNQLRKMEEYKNTLGFFKRNERRQYEEEKIPAMNHQIQVKTTELNDAKNHHQKLSQLLTEAERKVSAAKQKTEKELQCLKDAEKELGLSELEARAESGEENAQYQLVMRHFNDGRRPKAKELAAINEPGYEKARLEIEKIEIDEKDKAQIKKDLEPIRDVTSELISLYNRYKSVCRWDLVDEVDASIKEAKDTLEQIEKKYKEDRKKELAVIPELINKTREVIAHVEKAVESAEERKRVEKMLAEMNSARSSW